MARMNDKQVYAYYNKDRKLIICGHIRELESQYKIEIPKAIIDVIVLFYDAKINYVGQFLSHNAS